MYIVEVRPVSEYEAAPEVFMTSPARSARPARPPSASHTRIRNSRIAVEKTVILNPPSNRATCRRAQVNEARYRSGRLLCSIFVCHVLRVARRCSVARLTALPIRGSEAIGDGIDLGDVAARGLVLGGTAQRPSSLRNDYARRRISVAVHELRQRRFLDAHPAAGGQREMLARRPASRRYVGSWPVETYSAPCPSLGSISVKKIFGEVRILGQDLLVGT
ncbi:hypothetical protein EVAR_43347_1 [Eumeta japonica]|uniref:Uncharacterized protein n=1 Tax=Eumeta variegata TaxID=151549 RepID=A0A4C1WP51_EUMVA|nr:hypothetical protein EVAR_43347_1 [Eumeta japonica]